MENRWQLYEKGDYEEINASLDNRFWNDHSKDMRHASRCAMLRENYPA